MKAFFKLIRVQNLLIIAVTQYLMRWSIIYPLLNRLSVVNNEEVIHFKDFELQFNEFYFALLVLSTILITGAGYVINDYFDIKTDAFNRPDNVIVGREISRRATMLIHIIMNFTGIALGIFISFLIHLPTLAVIFLLVPGLLWFYSTTYKRQFLIGNIIVSFLTGLVPFMVVLFEVPCLNVEYGKVMIDYHANFNILFGWVGGFAIFAFWLTLIRELIKDMEDFEGDREYGRKTLPVMLGLGITKAIIVVLLALFLSGLMWVYFMFIPDVSTLVYLSIALVLPTLYLIFRLTISQAKKDYYLCSLLTKGIMLSGILYSVLAGYIIQTKF